jgi:hypothetical protein
LRTVDGGRGRESHRTTEIGKYPARGGNIEDRHPSPSQFSHATATPQSKRTSTHQSHETCSTGNVERTTASSSSPDAPVSAVSPTSSVQSPKDVTHTPTPSSYRRWPPTSLDSTKSCLNLHQRAVLRPRGHEATTNVRGAPSAAVSEHWAAPPRKSYWSLTEDDRASRLGQPRLMVHSRRRTRGLYWPTFSTFISAES